MKFIALVFFAALAGSPSGCDKMNENLNRGLEEEKSYTRAAMEKYRRDPKVFQGNPDVLEIWSRMDYVAAAVAKQNLPGNWANTTDNLNFLQPKIQQDIVGKPFCVIRQKNEIVVLRTLSKSVNCTTDRLTANVDTGHIRSGDMEFSGRTDFWIYVLKLSGPGISP